MTTHTASTDPASTDTDFLATTRSSYDATAADYCAEHPDGLGDDPLDLAMFTTFAELVRDANGADGRPVADVGSGPGYVTARLRDLGVRAFGVDLSPRMAELAREAHPDLDFRVGSMTALDVPDGSLAGILVLYSIIHVPQDQLPVALKEFERALAPGGHVLLAFQASDEPFHLIHLGERYGREISLDYWFRSPEAMAEALTEAGLEPRARLRREPWEGQKYSRGFVLARKPPVTPAR